MTDALPDVRAGQRWRLPGGEEVIVNAVDGEQVDGTLIQGATVAVWIKSRSDLRDASLVPPATDGDPAS
jgi:hypothetical protein